MQMTSLEKRFVNNPGHSRAVAEEAVRRLRHLPVQSSWSYLDVGCGNGAAALAIADAFGVHVVGVDVDPQQIALARAAATRAMEEVAREVLPPGYTFAWSGVAFDEKQSGGTSSVAFLFGLIIVFLVLSAQYESWSLPGAVMTAVPFGILGALVFAWLRGLHNDVYFQIGLLVLIGLGAKNAVLRVSAAVEFRHASRRNDDLNDRLRARNLALCVADSEKLATPVEITADYAYFRLRDEGYTPDDIVRWADVIREKTSGCSEVFVYFKHEESGKGPEFGKMLMNSLNLVQGVQ